MTNKRVGIALRPGAKKKADEWVGDSPARGKPAEEVEVPAIKRLTIDVSEELHTRLKVKAALEGVRMADLVRGWIIQNCD
jgi:hypothetical protein